MKPIYRSKRSDRVKGRHRRHKTTLEDRRTAQEAYLYSKGIIHSDGDMPTLPVIDNSHINTEPIQVYSTENSHDPTLATAEDIAERARVESKRAINYRGSVDSVTRRTKER